MEHLTANLNGGIRREVLNGREHIVAPVSMIVPGVLNGSQGPLLYSLEEMKKDPERWNGIPITHGHPSVNGQPVSARSPEILNSQGLGFVFNSRVNGKLTAEAWFDVENTKRVDPTILENLQQGQPIELSTGLFTETENKEGVFNNTPYRAIARNFKPDHLAILPNQKGACSLDDGCGVLVNQETKESLFQQFKKWMGVDQTNAPNTVENKMTKEELVNTIIKDNEVFNEEDREVLNQFSEQKLQTLASDKGSSLRRGTKSKQDEEEEEQTKQAANAALQGYRDCQGQLHVYNVEKGEWESKDEPSGNEGGNGKETNTENTQKPQTAEEWFDQAPPEIQEAVRNSKVIVEREKTHLIGQLTNNIKDEEEKTRQAERLSKKTLDELREDVKLLPVGNDDNPFRNSYFGAAVPTENTAKPKEPEKPEPLGLPVYNFESD